jgi:hypothetical protein
MQLTPCREINSSFIGVTGLSRTTTLQTLGRRGTMSALCQLVQAHRPHRQYKQDADSESCENGPNPIGVSNHWIPASVFVNLRVLPHCALQ